jgi:RsiW-degrading membrane proteinase PrsW (M82 family)
MFLLALALAPGLAIIFYIYLTDKYDREPLSNLLISFFLGAISTIPAIIIQTLLIPRLDFYVSSRAVIYNAIFSFLIVAPSEELSKFLMLRKYSYTRKAFNEPFDGIIYSVMVSMGFATLENIGYVFQHGFMTGIVRMFLSVPAHAAFGVLMGYHVGLAKMDPAKAGLHMTKGVLLAMLFHGGFDFFLFLQGSPEVTRMVSESALFVGAMACFYVAIRLSLRAIRLHQEVSRRQFPLDDNLL